MKRSSHTNFLSYITILFFFYRKLHILICIFFSLKLNCIKIKLLKFNYQEI